MSGGILCLWNSLVFRKSRILCNENYVVIDGLWSSDDLHIRWIVVYAPQNLSCKVALWSSLANLIADWDGFIMMMGDFNEVREAGERYGSIFKVIFKVKQADIFNEFISNSALIDVPLDGYNFTWPILLRENVVDYGPTPFQKLQNLKGVIRAWVASKKADAYNLKKYYQEQISSIDVKVDQGCASEEDLHIRNNASFALGDLNRKDSLDLAQKAKIKWAIEGDENTQFFHGSLKAKRRFLTIRGILKDGDWINEPSHVKSQFLEHFCGRAPGPDGFSFKFFTTFWDLIEEDVVWFVNEFFQSGYFPKGCNSSFISLIPKVTNAKFVSDFRPISLIGCQYKIIGKILVNRLSSVIGSCISAEQSAFIKGRNILDGPFIINEVLAWYCNHKRRLMIFKVDFEKVFDSVRGLRQGDPLSHFLFILAMEGLHALSCKAEDLGLFKGANIGRDDMNVSHLMYADDVIFLGECSVLGVGVSDLEVVRMAKLIRCGVASFPMKYLGVPVGCNMARFHGGVFDEKARYPSLSPWGSILKSVFSLKRKGIDLLSLCSRSIGNGESTKFWSDHWGGAESHQFEALKVILKDVVLSDHQDSWKWSLHASAGFSVASVRQLVDSRILEVDHNASRWNRCVPIKVNIFLWRLTLNKLPSRVNLDRKVTRSEGEARDQVIKLICDNGRQNNQTLFVPNFVGMMEQIAAQMRTSRNATALVGTGPDSNNGIAQCYGDLSSDDCTLCYAEARTVLPSCFPHNGARIYLDGCFMRVQNYYFFQEISGPNDTIVCGNKTRKSRPFQDTVRQAVLKAVTVASQDSDYFAREQMLVSGNESVYVLADCWRTLNSSLCRACLENASASISKCLPWSEGRALNTGCFMRYSDTNFLNPLPVISSSSNRGKIIAIVVSVVSSVAVLAVALMIVLYIWKRRYLQKKRKGSYDVKRLAKMLKDSSLNFKYSTVEKATGSWDESNKLGQGGFGTVYKGVLSDGREIAVKRLYFNNKFRAADFYNEVNMISSIEHKNLVRLLGCSCSGPESILVYEYLPNMSLDRFIFDATKGKVLNWEKRINILIGTAEGLVYLHENSKIRIIHRDIKAANILLDLRLRAKIADFGLARSFQDDKSHISTAIAGTLGYMAPEYLAHGQLTEKADVYSFGVLLLEVVTGMENNKSKTLEYTDSLVAIAWRHFQQNKVEEIFDPNLMMHIYPNINYQVEAIKVVHIGLLCTQEDPSLRPSMSTVLKMLAKDDEPLPAPSNPPFMDEKTMELNDIRQNLRHYFNRDDSGSVATVSQSHFFPRLTNPRGLNPPPHALPFQEVGVATSELFAPSRIRTWDLTPFSVILASPFTTKPPVGGYHSSDIN
ncbi:cysteine-rich receptor-like protein kinase 2 [Tanacetum coccineum]|uniref:Cysteine-rich receptor-like protein kinase 2 n=1 Tax=Tanacetum coccineum TaxID=301880 RepID=A0ABQ5DB99_9ASTR